MSANLIAALARKEAAQRFVEATLQEDYPPGASVRWLTAAGKIARGAVVATGCGERLRVRNAATGKCLWISAAWIAWAMQAERAA